MAEPSLRVLLVDDDAAIRRVLRTSFSELDLHVTEAARGEEALSLVKTASFDVVLLDVQMPGIGGIKTLVQLRLVAPHLPVLMVTVQDAEASQDTPLQIGDILVQPQRRVASKAGQPIHLTRKEFDILHYLMSNAGRAVTYRKLLSAVWGAECRDEIDYLRTFVRQLRKKIEDDPSNPRYLLTDAYVGYRFAEADLFEDA
jgi:two-component system KDP operon response regulator KdpE